MLSLDDDRWRHLTTFFGQPEELPSIIKDWLESIGSEQEEVVYDRDLVDIFLHQSTITNVAFAVVPWLLHVCKEHVTKLQPNYLLHIALVEANRLSDGLYYHRTGTEEYPEWLMVDYHQAILESRDLIDKVVEAENLEEGIRTRLVALRPALFGDADLAWAQWYSPSS